MTKTQTQAVAEAPPKNQLPAGYDMEELLADAAKNQVMSTGDVALPYIYMLQANSPQVNPGRSEYVQGAIASMFYDNVANVTYEGRETGLLVVPCAYERKYVEWVDRDAGGGWVADHDINGDIMTKTKLSEKKKPVLANGHIISETAYQYCLMLSPDSGVWGQCVIPLKSTGLKKNRRWNNMIVTTKIPGTEVQAPRWMHPYNIRTELESKGENSWWNLVVDQHEEIVSPDVYKAAKAYAGLVLAGLITRVPEATPGVGDIVEGEHREIDPNRRPEIPF